MNPFKCLGAAALSLLLTGATGLASDVTSDSLVPEMPDYERARPVAYEQLLENSHYEDAWCQYDDGGRKLFQSDHAFDRFIAPITNPVLTKDPRSLTEVRALFIHNTIGPENPLGEGDFQVYAAQIRIALTERLTFIADKDGYAVLNPKGSDRTDGFLNMAAGLKYTFLRDEEEQRLAAVGFMYEPTMGSGKVFQDHGDGLFTFFGTAGQEFGGVNHVIGNLGYQVPVDGDANSSLFYSQIHLDRQLNDWIYGLVELNWYHWVSSGDRGLPAALGEGDGLINLGTSGVAGNDLVTLAIGSKAKLSQNVELGVAWEFPISPREDLLDNRVTADLIFRY